MNDKEPRKIRSTSEGSNIEGRASPMADMPRREAQASEGALSERVRMPTVEPVSKMACASAMSISMAWDPIPCPRTKRPTQ